MLIIWHLVATIVTGCLGANCTNYEVTALGYASSIDYGVVVGSIADTLQMFGAVELIRRDQLEQILQAAGTEILSYSAVRAHLEMQNIILSGSISSTQELTKRYLQKIAIAGQYVKTEMQLKLAMDVEEDLHKMQLYFLDAESSLKKKFFPEISDIMTRNNEALAELKMTYEAKTITLLKDHELKIAALQLKNRGTSLLTRLRTRQKVKSDADNLISAMEGARLTRSSAVKDRISTKIRNDVANRDINGLSAGGEEREANRLSEIYEELDKMISTMSEDI